MGTVGLKEPKLFATTDELDERHRVLRVERKPPQASFDGDASFAEREAPALARLLHMLTHGTHANDTAIVYCTKTTTCDDVSEVSGIPRRRRAQLPTISASHPSARVHKFLQENGITAHWYHSRG